MANTLITPTIIAREALMVLQNNMVFGGLIYRDLDTELAARIGDTITIRKPATFTAVDSALAAYDTWVERKQVATETSKTVTLNKVPDVSFEVTAKELALSVVDFRMQFLTPACLAMAQYIDSLIAAQVVDIPYSVPVSSTPAISDIAAVNTKLSNNKAPFAGRNLVMNPTTYAKYLTLDAVLHAEKSGSTDALRNASIGSILGLDSYQDQNVAQQTIGTITAANASGTAGDTTVSLASVSASGGTIKQGQVFTIAGDSTQYVVTADKTATTTTLSGLPIYPALQSTASSAAITLVTDTTSNVAFHRNAFALASRPLADPIGGALAAVESYNGLSIRATYGYDMSTKTNQISLDMLVGVATLCPELACRLQD